jgi:predicted membrane protein
MKGFKIWIILSILLFILSFVEFKRTFSLIILAVIIFVVGVGSWIADDFAEYEKHKKQLENAKKMSEAIKSKSKKRQSRDSHGRFRKRKNKEEKEWEY